MSHTTKDIDMKDIIYTLWKQFIIIDTGSFVHYGDINETHIY